MALQTEVHVFLGDVTMPRHPRLTAFQHPSDLTVEIRPRRSMDLRLLLLREFDIQGLAVQTPLFSQGWSASVDHSPDLMVRKEPKGSSDQRSWSPRGSGLQRFWLHCHSVFPRQDSVEVPCAKPSTRRSDGREGAPTDSPDQ
jgi:hypothetical protein